MLEDTHRRIAKEIAKELKLGEREAGLLEAGSINPDSWADFPHHYGKDDEIMGNVLDARRLFLQADDECYYRLGIALHYIEDRWTMRPRMKDKHTEWEMKIDRVPKLNDSELIESIKRAPLPTKAEQAYLTFLEKISKGPDCMTTAECDTISMSTRVHYLEPMLLPRNKWRSTHHPKFELIRVRMPKHIRDSGKKVIAYALQGRPTPWSNPIFDFNFSYKICLEITRKVFSREHDEGDWYDVEAERHDMEITARKREIAVKEAEIAARERRKKEGMQMLALGLIIIIFSIAGFASGHVFLGILGVIYFVFGIILSIVGIGKLL